MSYEKGRKFEIYIEELFKSCGFENVERNLLYIRPSWFRKKQIAQVDIQTGSKGLISVPQIYELKYSSNGKISLSENPVDQLLRAARITCCMPGGVITNRSFTEGLINYARSKKVRLYDASYLTKLEKKRKSIDGHGLICLPFIGKDLEQRIDIVENDISRIKIKEYDLKAKTIYL